MDPIPAADRETDSGSYRSISGLAVAAAAAGVLSAGCLVSPALWVVPLVAIALAVAALREIGREGSVKVGRIPAILGLALAVGFGMQSVAYRAVNDWLVQARAATAAREFVRAARESRFTDARDMCGPTALPVRENFAAMPAVALLAGCPPSAEETMAAEPPPEDLPATHAFIVTVFCGPGDGRVEAGEARVRVVVHRDEPSDHSTGFERWSVVRHEVVAPLGRPVQ